jgi:hypothetical protein
VSEIAPRAGIPKRTLTPDTSAPSAPTITAPGAPVVTDPVSSGTRRREAEMRKKYEDIERRYGRNRDVGYRARRGEFRPKPAPATPVSDAYIITIRGKKEEPPGVSLDTLVIQQEQRKREDWIRDETVRAHVLPSQLQHEIAVASYHRQLDAYNKQLREYNKALDERRKLDEEAKKYGHNTYEELLAAIQEEKAIKRANELGKALTEAQLISQSVARGAAPPDYRAALEEQRKIAEAAQQSLRQNFGVDVGPKPQEYFKQVADFTASIQQPTPTPATTQAGGKGGAWVDPELGIRITAHPEWTATLSKPSKQPLPPGLGLPSPTPARGDPGGGVVLPWDVSAKREQYDIARAHYEQRLNEAERAGRIREGVFQVTDLESETEYLSLKAAGESLEQYGTELEDLQKRELFGIPAYFGEKETALAELLNLPELPKEEARAAAHLSAALPGSAPLPPALKELSHGLTYGAYTGIRDRPLTGLASLAVGVLGGAAVKGAAAIPKLGKVVTPTMKGLEAAWVGSIAGRTATSPDWFEAGGTLGTIATTEAAPVVAGAAAVQRAPGLVARPTGRPGPTSPPPPPRQTIVDVVGEVPSPRHIGTVGRTRVIDATGELPEIRLLGIDPYGVKVYDATGATPEPRHIGTVGRTRVIDVAGELPEIRPLGIDPYGVKVYDATGATPEIRLLGIDPYGVKVYDATGDFGDPAYLGMVDMGGTAPPRRLKPRAPGAGEPLTLYTPEALGVRQRAIMADRRHPGIPATPTAPRLISPESPTTTQTQVRPPNLIRPVGLVAIVPPVSRERQERKTAVSFDARTPMGAAPRIDLGIEIEPISATDVTPVSRVDPGLSELPTPTQTPGIEQTPLQTPDQAVDSLLRLDQVTIQIPRLDQVTIQIPRPVETPRPRRPVHPRPPRTPPLLRLDDDPRRGRDAWLEWWVHYAERPTPHARLESAYLGLPDPTPARSKVIKNIQRITIGTPPGGVSPSPLRTPTVTVGPRLAIAPRRLPGSTPTRRATAGRIGILEVF